jgi:hypothetical protein
MISRPSKYYKYIAHIAGWLLFFFFPLLISPHSSLHAEPGSIESLICRDIILMALFYLNLLYLTPELLQKRSLISFLIVSSLLVVFVSLINVWIHERLLGFENQPPPPDPEMQPLFENHHARRPPMMIAGPFFSSFLITSVVVTISTLIVLWNDWQRARENEQQRTLQKIAAELSVLKLQISPHFLFNTLNNIRWLVRSKSDQAEEAVVKLSQLLRYILYQTNDDSVFLRKEVEHLEDFINLQLIRLQNKESVVFNLIGAASNQMIVPLLFIPIVENFFKYGDFEITNDNTITLEIVLYRVKFIATNKIITESQHDKDASGIGLDNLKKRLNLHYADKHFIKTTEENGYFKVEMEIILN